MNLDLFVYWHVDADRADDAMRVARAFHERLTRTQPALRLGLYRRTDTAATGKVTLMETYSTAAGLDDAQQASVLAAAAAALSGYAQGERHVEVFERLHG